MIFPDIRISELEKDVEAKRRAFEDSQELFSLALHQKIRPVSLLTHNPKFVLGGLFTAFSALRFVLKIKSFFTGKKGGSFLWKLFKAGWVLKIMKTGASLLIQRHKKKEAGPLPFLLQTILKKLLKI